MRKISIVLGFVGLLSIAFAIAGCSSNTSITPPASGKTVATASAGNNLTATLATADGSFKKGSQDFILTFADASGKAVDVGSAAFNLHMAAMGSMAAMNNGATLTTTGTPGVYKGNVKVEMGGDWQAQITYEGPAGKGSFAMPISAK